MNELWAGLFMLWVCVALSAWWGTSVVRRYAIRRSIMDIPNDRSSHRMPTPRGGGLAIVVSFAAGAMILPFLSTVPLFKVAALLGGALVVALVGAVDDHGHVPAQWRLLVHFLGAAAVLWLVPASALAGLVQAVPAPLLYVGSAFFLVWLLNLFNFMDGIDGIAGVEAICVCFFGGWFALRAGGAELTLLAWTLAVSTSGFLVWNLPPAKIFMGDVGSGFLGLMLGALTMFAATITPQLFWIWIILLAVFISDATITLIRRILAGRRVHEAHRSHAYQRLAKRIGRHGPVTGTVLLINVAWLAPLAGLVEYGMISAPVGAFVAYLPVIVGVGLLGAGGPEESRDTLRK